MELAASVVAEVQEGIHELFNNGVGLLVAIAAAITALTVIFKFFRKVWTAYKVRADKAEQFYNDFFGVEANGDDPGKPGVMARLKSADEDRTVMNRTMNQLVTQQATHEEIFREFASTQREIKDRVEYEMSTNGGGSLRDEVRTIGVELQEVKSVVADHIDSLPHSKTEKEEG